jgi:hypothetical protein
MYILLFTNIGNYNVGFATPIDVEFGSSIKCELLHDFWARVDFLSLEKPIKVLDVSNLARLVHSKAFCMKPTIWECNNLFFP